MMRRRDEDGASLSKELKSFHSYANFAGGYSFALNPFICAIMSTLGLLVLRQWPNPSMIGLYSALRLLRIFQRVIVTGVMSMITGNIPILRGEGHRVAHMLVQNLFRKS